MREEVAAIQPHRRRRRPSRRAIVAFLLLFLGGALVNVAVAWSVAWCAPLGFEPYDASFRHAGVGRHEMSSARRLGLTMYYSHRSAHGSAAATAAAPRDLAAEAAFLPAWTGLREPSAPFAGITSGNDERVVYGLGWPWRSMWYEAWHDFRPSDGRGAFTARARGGIALPRPGDAATHLPWQVRALPRRPIPVGFALNTFVYGALLWLLIFAPGVARRARRRRRGACPACAYPRGESPVCTECGTPWPRDPAGSA